MTIAGGQGELQERSSGSATSAGSTCSTSRRCWPQSRSVLADLGAEIERGVAVTAALEAYEHQSVA
jgi:hypothetical protein